MEHEKTLAKLAKTNRLMAEAIKERTIGLHACNVVAASGDLTLGALIQSLRDEIDAAPSSRGKGSRDRDLRRLAAEAALSHLESLLPASA